MLDQEKVYRTLETRFSEQDVEKTFWRERITDTLLHHMCHTVDRTFALPMLAKLITTAQDYIDKTNAKKGLHPPRPSPSSASSAMSQVSQAGGSAGASPFMPVPAPSPGLWMSSPFDWQQHLPPRL